MSEGRHADRSRVRWEDHGVPGHARGVPDQGRMAEALSAPNGEVLNVIFAFLVYIRVNDRI